MASSILTLTAYAGTPKAYLTAGPGATGTPVVDGYALTQVSGDTHTITVEDLAGQFTIECGDPASVRYKHAFIIPGQNQDLDRPPTTRPLAV